jgi:G6PDH family F420-dependent oxidoreductase
VRLAMLEEAVEVIRRLWDGQTIDHRGEFYTVENARLFDPPTEAPPVIASGFGPKAVELAARIGDGYWGVAPDADALDRYRDAGGTGPRYAQLHVCWAEDPAEARKTVHQVWPNAGIRGQLSQDLPTWTHFEEAATMVTEEEAASSIPCGPDVDPFVESVKEYLAAGYDHLYFHQIGPDQDGFFRFWSDDLQRALAQLETTMEEQMPDKRPSVKNEKQYEALKDKGMSKEQAARIANAPGASSRGGKQSGKGGSAKRGGTAAHKKKAGRKGGKVATRKS